MCPVPTSALKSVFLEEFDRGNIWSIDPGDQLSE